MFKARTNRSEFHDWKGKQGEEGRNHFFRDLWDFFLIACCLGNFRDTQAVLSAKAPLREWRELPLLRGAARAPERPRNPAVGAQDPRDRGQAAGIELGAPERRAQVRLGRALHAETRLRVATCFGRFEEVLSSASYVKSAIVTSIKLWRAIIAVSSEANF